MKRFSRTVRLGARFSSRRLLDTNPIPASEAALGLDRSMTFPGEPDLARLKRRRAEQHPADHVMTRAAEPDQPEDFSGGET